MEEDEQEQRRRKVEAGRAKLAHFRQRKTKGDCAHSKKTPAKRKGAAVDAPDQEESPVAASEAAGLLGGRAVGKNASCSDTPDGAGAPQLQEPGGAGTLQKLEDDGPEQPGVMTKELELEVLRLSLSDMHAARLELTQAHLQREKEAALAELRAELAGRHAQERALLQSRAYRELELVREEAADLKEKLQSEMEKNAQMIETLKQDWESERDLSLEKLRRELSERHRSELENLQNQFKKELAEQKAELEKVFQDKNQAEFSLQTQEAQHEAALSKLRADLQLEHCQYVEDLELKFREKEKEKQLELENLRASYTELQAQSQEEIRRLGAQLESARSSRQEPSELPEQLLAQVSHVEGLEHLARALEQQQQERTRHEAQLEQLRISSEEKLREAERGHQEDLTLLQQRLQGGKDSSPPEAEGISACSEETPEEEGRDRLDQLGLQLEQHEVKCTLVEAHQEALKSAKEKLELMRRELSERETEWEVTSEDPRRGAEERPTQLLLELREQAESEKLSMMHRFELREAEMRQLQDQQAAQILDLEGSLMEQQGRLRQLELGLLGDESLQCSQCGRELGGGLAPTDRDHLKEDCALQLQLAQSRWVTFLWPPVQYGAARLPG